MHKAEAKAVAAMLIFGSIGLFVRLISLASSETAFYRAVLGSFFLLAGGKAARTTPFSFSPFKKNKWPLLVTGVALGLNWVFLFEAYKHTTLAAATISYYMAPVFVMLAAPFVLRERRTLQKTICAGIAVGGLALMMGQSAEPAAGIGSTTGIFFGLTAAIFYAAVMIGNKFFKDMSTLDTTLGQLVVAAVVLAPYVIFQEGIHLFQLDIQSVAVLLVVGILHTGLAYLLYFSALQEADVQTIALISYLDPISAVGFSVLFLQEPFTVWQLLGGLLVLGGAFLGEMDWNKRNHKLKI